jgi:hypothetical protein
MSRTRPVCQWNDAIVLSNAQQVQWRQTLLSNAITGFHSKDTKATFISWIAQSNYTHAWHVEDDATLHQSHPRTIAQKYNNSMADIIAVSWSRQVGGWVERTCNICTRDNVLKFGWPIARISRRLAREVVSRVQKGAHGHHEVLVGTICKQTSWCVVDVRSTHSFVGQINAAGGMRRKTYIDVTGAKTGKVYHPVRCSTSWVAPTRVGPTWSRSAFLFAP